MEIYVLEIGGPSYYCGHSVESRTGYTTYEEAKKAFDAELTKNYSQEELSDEDLISECSDTVNPEYDYLDSWMDGEADVYLAIYKIRMP